MASKKIEDVIAWQKARVLARRAYEHFRDMRDYAFRDQICRAELSVMNNIAEGIEAGTQKELMRCFTIARGSSGEVRSMLYAAYDLKYLSLKEFQALRFLTEEQSRIIAGFLKGIAKRKLVS